MDAHTSGGHATGAPARHRLGTNAPRHLACRLFVVAFLTPYVLADTLEIQRDVYYALYDGHHVPMDVGSRHRAVVGPDDPRRDRGHGSAAG